MVDTMIDAHDKQHISESKGNYARTIGIPTVININGIDKQIKTSNFDITLAESLLLYGSSNAVAKLF
ncbi:hypothetical protein SPSYN_01879 [Sporotomaculum syntrophicum]|uniref:Uncharacterized protein n=1 Tax=Sporotomaculum syntrophicum TaxID=182264 RepID=A0A9D2WQY3_9FIRM|nr:hypothetical protein SPSYN_01879 [Sporotomaculum syntrophicum]